MYLVEWNGGREIVGSIADVLQHPKLSIATVFERKELALDIVLWVAC